MGFLLLHPGAWAQEKSGPGYDGLPFWECQDAASGKPYFSHAPCHLKGEQAEAVRRATQERLETHEAEKNRLADEDAVARRHAATNKGATADPAVAEDTGEKPFFVDQARNRRLFRSSRAVKAKTTVGGTSIWMRSEPIDLAAVVDKADDLWGNKYYHHSKLRFDIDCAGERWRISAYTHMDAANATVKLGPDIRKILEEKNDRQWNRFDTDALGKQFQESICQETEEKVTPRQTPQPER
ncbi:MAG: hypothetical protein HQL57_07140 [Magnetococcales bacterium]|nr:hypothetical protein [Magnetococcales bacterium]MBF0156944.1 hypothetical protein [Magnetococcales bacterium]